MSCFVQMEKINFKIMPNTYQINQSTDELLCTNGNGQFQNNAQYIPNQSINWTKSFINIFTIIMKKISIDQFFNFFFTLIFSNSLFSVFVLDCGCCEETPSKPQRRPAVDEDPLGGVSARHHAAAGDRSEDQSHSSKTPSISSQSHKVLRGELFFTVKNARFFLPFFSPKDFSIDTCLYCRVFFFLLFFFFFVCLLPFDWIRLFSRIFHFLIRRKFFFC